MSKYTALNPTLYQYLLDHSVDEDAILSELRDETEQIPLSQMQIGADQGRFLQMLIKITGAKRILEVGTYTGYSSLAMALALPEDGKIICCDISEQWTSIARKYWEKAEVKEKIELILAPANKTLAELLETGYSGTFDMMFIDADKENYATYYELGLKLVKKGGLILVDNVLWDGKVIDEHADEKDTRAIKALNQRIAKDKRVEMCMLPLADGLSIARVK
jgi:predicted O-methyltransferase YrrM